MSIRPIDVQVLYPKVTEVSKTKSDEQNKDQTLVQQQAHSTKNNSEHMTKQVHSKEKAQEARIKEKEKREENRKNKKKKGKKEDDEESTIDIKI